MHRLLLPPSATLLTQYTHNAALLYTQYVSNTGLMPWSLTVFIIGCSNNNLLLSALQYTTAYDHTYIGFGYRLMHAVRSAIIATAELLVCFTLFHSLVNTLLSDLLMLINVLADRTATQYDRLVYGAKSCTSALIPSRHVPICPFRHFAV